MTKEERYALFRSYMAEAGRKVDEGENGRPYVVVKDQTDLHMAIVDAVVSVEWHDNKVYPKEPRA